MPELRVGRRWKVLAGPPAGAGKRAVVALDDHGYCTAISS
jgi:hypothetical protein